MTTKLRIARAENTKDSMKVILGLIDEASRWLPLKGTDQWKKPWPGRRRRNIRIRQGLKAGATWIVWDGDRAVATVTAMNAPNFRVWSGADCDLSESAVYAHRLIVARDFAGWELGAELINWTALRGCRDYGAKWIRIDVWSSNEGLHEYYMKRGFKACGQCLDPNYPSGKLFQKAVSGITEPERPQFIEYGVPLNAYSVCSAAAGDSPLRAADEDFSLNGRSRLRRTVSISR